MYYLGVQKFHILGYFTFNIKYYQMHGEYSAVSAISPQTGNGLYSYAYSKCEVIIKV